MLNQQPSELMIFSMHYCSSFCLVHRPTQGVSLKLSSNQICPICFCKIEWNSKTSFADIPLVTPCCKNAWFHNSCLQVTRISFLKHYCNSCKYLGRNLLVLHSCNAKHLHKVWSSRTSRFPAGQVTIKSHLPVPNGKGPRQILSTRQKKHFF